MLLSISSTVAIAKKFKDLTINRLDNEREKPCVKFCEAIQVIYGPYVKNKVVIQHAERLMSQAEGAEDILPGLDDPDVRKLLAAAKIQEEKFENGNNFIFILCGLFLKNIQSLKTSGIFCNDIHTGYSAALIEALRVLDIIKVDLNKINIKDKNKHKTDTEIPDNIKIERKQDCLLSCEMDFSKKVKFNGKNELLIKEGESYYNTKVIFDCKGPIDDSCGESACDGFFEFDEIFYLIKYRLSYFSNRKMETNKKPVNIVLYSSDIDSSSIYFKDECVMNNLVNKLNFIDTFINIDICEFKSNVIVAVGHIDNLALSKINQEGILAVTVENHFELQRLQKAVGGSLIPDFTDIPKKKHIGQALSVKIEELSDGIFIAVFKVKENETNTKTVVVRDITKPDVKFVNGNSDKKITTVIPGAGVTEYLIGKRIDEFAESFSNIQNVILRSFSEAIKEFSAILETTTSSTPASNSVDDHGLLDLVADFDVKDRTLVIQALKNGMVDSFEEKCEVIEAALHCAFDILNINHF